MNIYFTYFVKFSTKSISTHAQTHIYAHASRRPTFLLITIIAFIRRIIASFFIIRSIITAKNGERAQESGAKRQTDRQKRRDSEEEEEKKPSFEGLSQL